MNALRCLAGVVAALALVSFAAPTQAGDEKKPNVLIILLDDVGYGDFSCHGNPVMKTPNVDRLYKDSIRLTDFHVCPMCTPTRGQILTGIDCLRNGAMNVSSGRTPLRKGVPTMADLFKAQGYRTGHFGKWHLGDNYPYRPQDRGFEETVHCKSWGMASAADYFNNDCMDDYYSVNGEIKQIKGYNTDVFFGETRKFIKACKEKKKPFLVYLPLTAAHGPHFIPEDFVEPYAKQKPNVAKFFGMIANLDEDLGRLDQFLKAEKLIDDTILIFMTDNGGTAGVPVFNAGMRGSKTTYYEGGHRVPCFIRWPGGKLRPAGDLPGLTQAQDLLPTLLGLCGSPIGNSPDEGMGFDGLDLSATLRDENAKIPERTLIVQYSRINPQQPKKGDACVMWQNWRLVEDKELYDLKADPAQKDNVIDKHPQIVKQLREHYSQWWAKVEKNLDQFNPIYVGSDKENPVRLSPCDWQDMHCDQSAQVRRGDKKNGPWNVLVEKDGEYEITLRRWPKEADLTITAASPAFKSDIGQFPAGVALPIAKARLKIADFDQTQAVKESDKGITFSLKLKAGRTQLLTSFLDKDGQELCGAYYTEVRRK